MNHSVYGSRNLFPVTWGVMTMATRRKSTKSTGKTAAAKQPKEKERQEQVKAMDFVPVWQSSDNAADVGEHFGRDAAWAGQYASRLRSMDVDLKKMPRGSRKGLDIDELNALAKSSLKE